MCDHVIYVYMCMHECIYVFMSVSVGDRRTEGDAVVLLSAHKKTTARTAWEGALMVLSKHLLGTLAEQGLLLPAIHSPLETWRQQ